MSKELTEKFMNDELDDRLYYFTQKMSQDNVEIGRSFAFNMVRADDDEYLDWFLIHEVLAPVPTYDQFVELTEKVERLEKQLNEANEVIKWYDGLENILIGWEMIAGQTKGTAKEYLEKWGVK